MGNRKYIILTFLTAGFLVGFAVLGLAGPLLALLEVGDPQILGLVNATALVGIVVGLATFLGLNRHRGVYVFTNEVITELRKVVWPDKEETVRSTTVVLTFTFIIAGALALYDFVWARLTSVFLFTEG